MTEYILNRERIRVVKKDDRGRVTSRRRFNKGDVVVGLDDLRIEQLLASGAIVERGAENVDDSDGHPDPADYPDGSGDGTGDPGDGADGDGDGDGDPDSEPDPYADMEYADLQQAAKAREINAGGSAQDLRERLKAFDDEQVTP